MASNYLKNGPITLSAIAPLMDKMGENDDCGGHSVFMGQVRSDEIGGKKVKAIEYSAYDEMVNNEAEKIKHLVLMEFGDAKSVEILHSTGVVKAGELSLFVLVSAGHRHQAIQACTKTVELIKEKLPVWKKEIFDDDSHDWKQNISS